jgi:hypothetical protein
MYERCPACGLKFEREDGYFLGAMYIGYGLGIGVIAVLSALVWDVLKWPLTKSVVGGIDCSCLWSRADVDGAGALDLHGPGDRSRPKLSHCPTCRARIKAGNFRTRDLHAGVGCLLYNPR